MRVLIVDDDEMVRSVCSGMLHVMFHEAVAVASGAAAIELILQNDSRFDLILLDDVMPGMSGRETFAQLMALDIRVPVVVCSGRNVMLEEFAVSAGRQPVGVLEKPFTLRGLQSTLALAFPG